MLLRYTFSWANLEKRVPQPFLSLLIRSFLSFRFLLLCTTALVTSLCTSFVFNCFQLNSRSIKQNIIELLTRVVRKQLTSYVPKHILDIGRPKKKEGSRNSVDRRSSVEKPPASKSEQAADVSKSAEDDETSQESQNVDVSNSATAMSESPTEQTESMTWHPSDNSSANAVPAAESSSEHNVSKENTEVGLSRNLEYQWLENEADFLMVGWLFYQIAVCKPFILIVYEWKCEVPAIQLL